jgi:uncharacterized protein
MSHPEPASELYSAFANHRRIASGSKQSVAVAVAAYASRSTDPVIILSDQTGRVIDLDLRGTPSDIQDRYAPPAPLVAARPSRGRPKLGVVPREVTLLARHWEWLSTQPGGASAAIRRLVDQARQTSGPADEKRQALEAKHRKMTALAGDLPGFEEALRALYAGDHAQFQEMTRVWPNDVRGFM